jgi:hypothetical protein
MAFSRVLRPIRSVATPARPITRVAPVSSLRPLAATRVVPLTSQPVRHLNLHEYQSTSNANQTMLPWMTPRLQFAPRRANLLLQLQQ